MTAIFLAPVLVQIQQQIQATVESEGLVFIEVGVNAQLAALRFWCSPPPSKRGIGNQVLDSGHLSQEFPRKVIEFRCYRK